LPRVGGALSAHSRMGQALRRAGPLSSSELRSQSDCSHCGQHRRNAHGGRRRGHIVRVDVDGPCRRGSRNSFSHIWSRSTVSKALSRSSATSRSSTPRVAQDPRPHDSLWDEDDVFGEVTPVATPASVFTLDDASGAEDIPLVPTELIGSPPPPPPPARPPQPFDDFEDYFASLPPMHAPPPPSSGTPCAAVRYRPSLR
jgi:hypothetical protein